MSLQLHDGINAFERTALEGNGMIAALELDLTDNAQLARCPNDSKCGMPNFWHWSSYLVTVPDMIVTVCFFSELSSLCCLLHNA